MIESACFTSIVSKVELCIRAHLTSIQKQKIRLGGVSFGSFAVALVKGTSMKRGFIGALTLGLFLFFAIISTSDLRLVGFFAGLGAFLGVVFSGGGEFNPAASLVNAVKASSEEARKISLMDMAGGFAGFFVAAIIVRLVGALGHLSLIHTRDGLALYLNRQGRPVADLVPRPATGWSWQVFFLECLVTTLLVLVIVLAGRFSLSTMSSAMLVGTVIGVGVFSLATLTGGSLNFARYFGPELLGLVTGHGLLVDRLIYYMFANVLIPVAFVSLIVPRE